MTSLDQKMFPNFVARERSQKRRSLNGCRQKGRFHNQKSTRSGKLSSQGRRNERTSLASNPLSGNILIFKECKGRLTDEAYCFAMHEATFDENTHNIMATPHFQQSDGHFVVRDVGRDQHVSSDKGQRHQGRSSEVPPRTNRVLSKGNLLGIFSVTKLGIFFGRELFDAWQFLTYFGKFV